MGTLGPSYQRFLAVFILVAILWCAFTWVIAPVFNSFSDRQEAIKDGAFRLAQIQSVNARQNSDGPALASAVERADAAGLILPETDVRLASANLQARVARILERNSVSVISNQSEAESDEAGLTKVSVRLRILGDLPKTQAALHAIEKSTPYLFVESASLRPSRQQAATTISLESNLTVSAYMIAGQGA